jgi:hypothetical protein
MHRRKTCARREARGGRGASGARGGGDRQAEAGASSERAEQTVSQRWERGAHLLAEDPRHPLSDRLVLALGRSGVPDEGADGGADLAGPREQLARQAKLEHAVGPENELELPLGPLAALALWQWVQLAVVVHPRGQRLVREDQLVVDAELIGDANDAGLCRKRVRALLPDEPVLVVRDHVASHVVARLGEQHVDARAMQVVRQRGSRDASAHDERVSGQAASLVRREHAQRRCTLRLRRRRHEQPAGLEVGEGEHCDGAAPPRALVIVRGSNNSQMSGKTTTRKTSTTTGLSE